MRSINKSRCLKCVYTGLECYANALRNTRDPLDRRVRRILFLTAPEPGFRASALGSRTGLTCLIPLVSRRDAVDCRGGLVETETWGLDSDQ